MASSTSKRQYFSRTALEHSVRILNVCNNNDKHTGKNMVYILTANFSMALTQHTYKVAIIFIIYSLLIISMESHNIYSRK